MDEENPNKCWYDSGKWFYFSIFPQVAMTGKRLSSRMHLQKRV
jgi:hypothetical protein